MCWALAVLPQPAQLLGEMNGGLKPPPSPLPLPPSLALGPALAVSSVPIDQWGAHSPKFSCLHCNCHLDLKVNSRVLMPPSLPGAPWRRGEWEKLHSCAVCRASPNSGLLPSPVLALGSPTSPPVPLPHMSFPEENFYGDSVVWGREETCPSTTKPSFLSDLPQLPILISLSSLSNQPAQFCTVPQVSNLGSASASFLQLDAFL